MVFDHCFRPGSSTTLCHPYIGVIDNAYKRVCVLSENGDFERHFHVPYHGCSLAATEDNYLVIASKSKAVMVYKLNGTQVDEFGGDSEPQRFDGPCGICVDNNGQVYVADNNRVLVYRRR